MYPQLGFHLQSTLMIRPPVAVQARLSKRPRLLVVSPRSLHAREPELCSGEQVQAPLWRNRLDLVKVGTGDLELLLPKRQLPVQGERAARKRRDNREDGSINLSCLTTQEPVHPSFPIIAISGIIEYTR
jgi:hypothetical protein